MNWRILHASPLPQGANAISSTRSHACAVAHDRGGHDDRAVRSVCTASSIGLGVASQHSVDQRGSDPKATRHKHTLHSARHELRFVVKAFATTNCVKGSLVKHRAERMRLKGVESSRIRSYEAQATRRSPLAPSCLNCVRTDVNSCDIIPAVVVQPHC
eukprot:CAMPEP_0119339524 /NCGR_PEP_ID=MMETSP1333-20130426/98421_1 /TAXON_ID=418940 /ORGANISM="Scyphosphaera apsteinii, Strain RCC1455" /LENGTH=157 /DNA_ID=CAMNT_0007351051 /DNA_START=122 /DNA_END=596 /DNA_ORIENTATION=+